jgi:hypothetical protein
MTKEKYYDALSQKHLVSIKHDMRASLEDATVRATHKVVAELETDCVGWFGYDTGLSLWFETNKGDDDAIPLYKDAQKRPWVGLTDDDWNSILYDTEFHAGAEWAEAKLKEKNT